MNVAIVITNYNYARFVGQAIESALAQTWRPLQVIVIDDGSTDDSWAAIQRFGRRIQARRVDNAGQGGATNVGLAMTQADFVLFLDSDDFLDPRCVSTCIPLFAPGVAKVQFALHRVDAQGRRLGAAVPYLMHEGDVRPMIRMFGYYAGPPSSGNFYRRSAIARYYPLEAARWRYAADTVPFLLAPFNGPVASAAEVLGSYRLHQSERAPGLFGNVGRSFAEELRMNDTRRDRTLELLARHDGIRIDGPFLPLPWSVRTRALSWKLARADHAYPDDSVRRLLRLQADSMRAWPGYRRAERWAALCWVAAMTLLPAPLAARLARTNTSAALRAFFRQLGDRPA